MTCLPYLGLATHQTALLRAPRAAELTTWPTKRHWQHTARVHTRPYPTLTLPRNPDTMTTINFEMLGNQYVCHPRTSRIRSPRRPSRPSSRALSAGSLRSAPRAPHLNSDSRAMLGRTASAITPASVTPGTRCSSTYATWHGTAHGTAQHSGYTPYSSTGDGDLQGASHTHPPCPTDHLLPATSVHSNPPQPFIVARVAL